MAVIIALPFANSAVVDPTESASIVFDEDVDTFSAKVSFSSSIFDCDGSSSPLYGNGKGE